MVYRHKILQYSGTMTRSADADKIRVEDILDVSTLVTAIGTIGDLEQFQTKAVRASIRLSSTALGVVVPAYVVYAAGVNWVDQEIGNTNSLEAAIDASVDGETEVKLFPSIALEPYYDGSKWQRMLEIDLLSWISAYMSWKAQIGDDAPPTSKLILVQIQAATIVLTWSITIEIDYNVAMRAPSRFLKGVGILGAQSTIYMPAIKSFGHLDTALGGRNPFQTGPMPKGARDRTKWTGWVGPQA